MQLTLRFPSPNQHWDTMHELLEQSSATKVTLALSKNLTSNYPRRKRAGGTLSGTDKFGHY